MRRPSSRKPTLRRRVAAMLGAALAGLTGLTPEKGRVAPTTATLAASRVRARRFPRLGEARRQRERSGGDFAPVSFFGGDRAAFPEE